MTEMKSSTLTPLLLLLLVSSVQADCDYDDDWCCDPRTWCEAWHFAFYQFLIGMLFYSFTSTLLDKAKLLRLARGMIQTGRATPAKVIAVQSKRVNMQDAPFAIMEYAALVEFQSLPSRDVVLKWVKITNARFQEIKTDLGGQLMPTIPSQEIYYTSITQASLQSLRALRASRGMHELIIYNWPAYPKSAVSSDVRSVDFSNLQKIVFPVLFLFMAGMMVFMFGWFASIYNYNLFQAGTKFLLLVVVQIVDVCLVWRIVACLKEFEKERNFILNDHVQVVGGEPVAGYDAVGRLDPPSLPDIV